MYLYKIIRGCILQILVLHKTKNGVANKNLGVAIKKLVLQKSKISVAYPLKPV